MCSYIWLKLLITCSYRIMIETQQLNCSKLKVRPKLDYIKWIKLPRLQTLIDFAINSHQVGYSNTKQNN
ncbi:hypothetical protein ACJW31_01G190900 [Castanea mollissima]